MPQPSLLGFLQDKDSQQAVGRGLLDAANRGWIAQTFGAPVDMATQAVNLGIAGAGYLGHKAGLLKRPPALLDSASVPGSSEWIGQKMQNAGMVSPNRNPIAEAGMGLLSPVAFKGAQKVGGLLANVEMKAAENLAQPSAMARQGQRGVVIGKWVDAYHGTTSDFDPKSFDLAKVGASSAHDSADAPAMWTSRSPKVASIFATHGLDDATPISSYGSAGQGTGAIRTYSPKDGGNIQPLKVRLQNPLVLKGAEAERMILGGPGTDASSSGGAIKDFVQAAIDAGHDGIIIKANPRGALEFRAEQYVLFDPSSQAKSKFAR